MTTKKKVQCSFCKKPNRTILRSAVGVKPCVAVCTECIAMMIKFLGEKGVFNV